MRVGFYILILFFGFGVSSCDKKGCTDDAALNYSSEAKTDDGTCLFSNSIKQGALSWKITSILGKGNFKFNSKFKINDSVYAQYSLCQLYMGQPKLLGYLSVSKDTTFTDNYLMVKTDLRNYDLGKVNEGTYSGFQFYLGIDSLTNNTKKPSDFPASHALSNQVPNMHPNSANQYYFLKLEGLYDSDFDSIPDAKFEYHIGANNYYTNITAFTSTSVLINENKNELLEVRINWSEFLKGVDVLARPSSLVPDSISDKIINNIGKVFN